MRIMEGKLEGAGLKIALIVSRFNSFITERLAEGALDCLRRHGVPLRALPLTPEALAQEILRVREGVR